MPLFLVSFSFIYVILVDSIVSFTSVPFLSSFFCCFVLLWYFRFKAAVGDSYPFRHIHLYMVKLHIFLFILLFYVFFQFRYKSLLPILSFIFKGYSANLYGIVLSPSLPPHTHLFITVLSNFTSLLRIHTHSIFL